MVTVNEEAVEVVFVANLASNDGGPANHIKVHLVKCITVGFIEAAGKATHDFEEKLRNHGRILWHCSRQREDGSGKTAAVWVTACLGISRCGDRFESRPEQEEPLENLKHTERKHARHNMSTQKYISLGLAQGSIK